MVNENIFASLQKQGHHATYQQIIFYTVHLFTHFTGMDFDTDNICLYKNLGFTCR